MKQKEYSLFPYSLPERDLGRVGVADLYPPGVRGGGMLFDPFCDKSFGPYRPGLGVPGGLPPYVAYNHRHRFIF